MKLDETTNNDKDISPNEWKKKLISKIKEIEPLIKNSNLEEKRKTLEIQKNNAYYKLEKIAKELQNVENFIEEDYPSDEQLVETEDTLKKKNIRHSPEEFGYTGTIKSIKRI